ncbi:DUF6249 domain-containing protein [Daejeonella sp.]|uniref:DUF6249 domain-containing protein n=1 Tax=Daejeonella sp. TaxID=2805397 RepID=UPI0030BEB172
MREFEVLIPILVSLGFFACVFGLRYLKNKENMALIQNGMDPGLTKQQPYPYQTLKWGLLLMGLGIGLFLAFILDHTVFNSFTDPRYSHRGNDGIAAIYFSLLGIFGGLGLFISYLIEKKETGAKN